MENRDRTFSRLSGRAECYRVIDETATLREALENPFKDYDHAVITV